MSGALVAAVQLLVLGGRQSHIAYDIDRSQEFTAHARLVTMSAQSRPTQFTSDERPTVFTAIERPRQ